MLFVRAAPPELLVRMPPRAPPVDLYATLEVNEDASSDTVKRAYRQLVLKWHPDKHPGNHPKAEAMIRTINAAYEVLGNPTKRETYDLQRSAADQARRGVAPKPRSAPRMLVPKEFMMQPMGCPELFARYCNRKLSVMRCSDAKGVDSNQFFQETKMSLWWVPEVNNMCRIRALGSRAHGDKKQIKSGLAGGLNLAFKLPTAAKGPQIVHSDVTLAAAQKGEKSDNVNFVTKVSPTYEGAFRFETASRRGHYLAYIPPKSLKIVPFLEKDDNRVLDFMLVDFTTMFKFIDFGDVLTRVVRTQRESWVLVSSLCDHADIKTYFRKVHNSQESWDAEDLAAYFLGHWTTWEYDSAKEAVRLRLPREKLGFSLRLASAVEDVTAAFVEAGNDLHGIPLVAAARAMELLSGAKNDAASDEATNPKSDVAMARQKLLGALRAIRAAAQKDEHVDFTLSYLMESAERAAAVCEHATSLFETVLFEKLGTIDDVTPSDLLRLLALPGAAKRDQQLAAFSAKTFAGASFAILAEALEVASDASVTQTRGAIAQLIEAKLEQNGCGDSGMDALLELARHTRHDISRWLKMCTPDMAAPTLASLLLVLLRRGTISDDDLFIAAESLAAKQSLEGVPSDDLVALAVAASQNAALCPVVNALTVAAAASAASWDAGHAVRFMLAIARLKDMVEADTLAAFTTQFASPIRTHLPSLDSSDLVKLVLSASTLGRSQLLEELAQATSQQLSKFTQSELLLVTQGLAQGLGWGHVALQDALRFWVGVLAAGRAASAGSACLAANQRVKLLQLVAPAYHYCKGSAQALVEHLLEAIAGCLVDCRDQLSALDLEHVSAMLHPPGLLAHCCEQGGGALARLASMSGDTACSVAGPEAPARRRKRKRHQLPRPQGERLARKAKRRKAIAPPA